MLNNVVLMGRLTADPDLKTVGPEKINLATFTLAVQRNYKTGDNYKTDFIPVSGWNKTAKFAGDHLHKGDLIVVSGSIKCERRTAESGEKQAWYEVVADEIHVAKHKENGKSLEALQIDDFKGV